MDIICGIIYNPDGEFMKNIWENRGSNIVRNVQG